MGDDTSTSPHAGRQNLVIHVRRIHVLSSWTTVGAILLVLGLAAGVVLRTQQHQAQQRSDDNAIGTARIIAALTVRRNMEAIDFQAGGQISPVEAADLYGDVAAMRTEYGLVGIDVWRIDGSLLYSDTPHPTTDRFLSAGDVARMKLGKSWVTSRPADATHAKAVVASIPYRSTSQAAPDGLVLVLLPHAKIVGATAASNKRLYGLAVLFLVAAAGTLIFLRRRMQVRDHQTRHDRLTDLLNWAGFRAVLERSLPSTPDATDTVAAVLLVDLDGFKAVNDTLGHPAGDKLLIQVGAQLRGSVRPNDAVARLGGDEFAILLTDLHGGETAVVVAQAVLARLRAGSFAVDGIALNVDASIGVALVTSDCDHADKLVQRADVAMYQAKRTGCGVATYDEATDPHDVSELSLLVELRRAIDNDELVLHYQPIAHLADGSIGGTEALVRWQHPTRGLLGPDSFIPLAENTGLMQPLTEWVLRRAVNQAADWHRSGLPLPVAVNISPRSLVNGDLPGFILALLAEAGVPSDLLEIEVTETAIMEDPTRAARALGHLNAMGVRISIDDFGTGYTSLALLKSLPVTTLKIDRTFISEIVNDDKDAAIAESVITLGHRLGLTVLAEGIETKGTWTRLVELGCDEGQGYLLAKPMAPELLEGWVTAHRHDALAAAGPAEGG